jgi:hypothetical protein
MLSHQKFLAIVRSTFLLTAFFGPALYSGPPPELNDSERALYEVLRRVPRFEYGEILFGLVARGSADFEIEKGLTPQSLDKLNQYLPGLLEIVQKGRDFRVDYLNRTAVEAEIMAFSDHQVDPNPAKRVLRTYYELLKAYSKKKLLEADERKLRPIAYETVRSLHDYPLTTPMSEWDLEHQAEFNTTLEKLKRFHYQPRSINELPEGVFEQWYLNERRRIALLRDRISSGIEVPITLPHELRTAVTALLDSACESTKEVDRIFRGFRPPKDVDSFLDQLESAAINGAERLRKTKKELLGDPVDRRGGTLSPLRKPEHAWIQDIFWWGMSDRGTRSPGAGLSAKWVRKAKRSKRLLGIFPFLKNPSIQKVAQPDKYREMIEERGKERYENTKSYVKQGAKVGLILAAVIAALERGYRYAPSLFQSASNYMSGSSSSLETEAPEPWELFPSPLKSLSKNEASPRSGETRGQPSAGQGDVIPGARDPHPKSNSKPSRPGTEKPHFVIKPLALGAENLPLEFEFANAGESGNSVQTPPRPGDRAAFSIESTVALAMDPSYSTVSLLGVPGFVPVITEAYCDGKKIVVSDIRPPPRNRRTFTVNRNPRSGASWLRVSGPPAAVAWKADYYPVLETTGERKILPPSSLPPIPLNQAGWLQALLQDAKHTAQADDLEQLIGESISLGTPVRPEGIALIVKSKSKYSTEAADEIDSPSLFNPLLGFGPYLREAGIDCFDCDGARNMLGAELKIGWEAEGLNIEMENRSLYVRKPDSLNILPSNRHARLAVHTRDFARNETVIFDPTPTVEAKGSPNRVQAFATPLTPDGSGLDKSLQELSRQKFDQTEGQSKDGLSEETTKEKPHAPAGSDPLVPPTDSNSPRSPLVIDPRERRTFENENRPLRHRNYHQLPPPSAPLPPPLGETDTPLGEALAQPREEAPRFLERPPPTPPAPEPQLDEAAILREAHQELERRRRRNETLLEAVATQKVKASSLAGAAEAASFSARDPADPHNAATRITSRIGAYITGEISSFAQLRQELSDAGIPVPENLDSEEELRTLIEATKKLFEKGQTQLEKLEARPRILKQENTKGLAFGKTSVKRAIELLGVFNFIPIQPVQSEDFQTIYDETRERHIRRLQEKHPDWDCAEALGRL